MNGCRITVSALGKKRVVCTDSGRVLGKIRDVSLETSTGRVLSVKVSRVFGRGVDVEWEKILLVGEDTVLVEGVTREEAKAFVLFE